MSEVKFQAIAFVLVLLYLWLLFNYLHVQEKEKTISIDLNQVYKQCLPGGNAKALLIKPDQFKITCVHKDHVSYPTIER